MLSLISILVLHLSFPGFFLDFFFSFSYFNGQESLSCKARWHHLHFKRLKLLIFFSISLERFGKLRGFYYTAF